jgi:P-type Ca2+ transporter type 2C
MIGINENIYQLLKAKYGSNEITKQKKTSALELFLHQFKNPLIYILLVIALITLLLQEYVDTVVIIVVVLFNSIIGFLQERKAENTVAALKELIHPRCQVRRNGENISVASKDLVPGDIVQLEAGDIVPADGIVISSKNLQIVESQLTGESYPVKKFAADRNMIEKILATYMSADSKFENVEELVDTVSTQMEQMPSEQILYQTTSVAVGKAELFVAKIGMATRVGNVSKIVLSQVKDATPLESKIKKITKIVVFLSLFSILSFVVLGAFRGYGFEDLLLTSISLGVSAVPEGLPVVVTLTLAIGAWRMGRKGAVLKNLTSVSTLAGTDVICTDKTGTLTKGELTLNKIYLYDEIVKGDKNQEFYHQAMSFGMLCNDTTTMDGKYVGDPLDVAIVESGVKYGINFEDLQSQYTRLDEIPFDSKQKYMVTLHRASTSNLLVIKGAPEVLLNLCDFENAEDRGKISEFVNTLNEKGLRTILLATRHSDESLIGENISNLSFVGLYEFMDPIRKDARQAVGLCKLSGITPVMITGDHIKTANYVAREVGIIDSNEDISLLGEEVANMDEDKLKTILSNVKVIARADPEVKMMLVDMYQDKGSIVAMTGDGINDAPALTAADIGIAMGKTGTDVARESSDMVITNDKFSVIVKGVEEARVVFENLIKVILYLFSTSLSEIILILLAIFLGYPLPLVAVQLLWLNLVTDGFLDVALATEPEEEGIMKFKPFRYTKNLLQKRHFLRIAFLALIMGLGSLGVFIYAKDSFMGIEKARTFVLVVMAAFQWFNAFNVRCERRSVFQKGIFSNKALLLALVVVVLLQLMIVYIPFFHKYMYTTYLTPSQFGIGVLVGSSIFVFEEIRKIIVRLVSPNELE